MISEQELLSFLGVVGGVIWKKFDSLQYEAFAEMAEKKMAEIGAEVREKWDVNKSPLLTGQDAWR